jgi:hypothetical protein
MVDIDGEEQLFDPKHPVWRIILIALMGLLTLAGVANPSLIAGVL